MKKSTIKTLIIPAAGAGTRLLPLSRVVPKEMFRIVDKPAIYYVVLEGYEAGIRNFVLVINPWKASIQNYFSDKKGKSLIPEFSDAHFSFIKTNDKFGDGHALYLARKMVHENFFAVSMADLMSLPGNSFIKQLSKAHEKVGEPVISVEYVPKNHVDRYGIVSPGVSKGTLYEAKDIVEKPSVKEAPSNLAMTGKYIVPKTIFSYLQKLLQKRKLGEEVRLADALKEYVKMNLLYALACKGKHFDVGNKPALLKTEFAFALEDKKLGPDFKDFVHEFKRGRKDML